MELTGRKIAILLDDGYEDLEFWYPKLRFQEAGAEVLTIAKDPEEVYISKHGYEAFPDVGPDQVDMEDFDAIYIPGGYAPDNMRTDEAMVDLVREADAQGKIVAAICHGGSMLVSAGIVNGHRVTSWPSIRADLEAAGAEWVDEQAVQDDNLVTSRNPEDLPAFCRMITRCLAEPAAREVAAS